MQLYYGARDNLVHELTYSSANRCCHSGFSFATLSGNSGIELYDVVNLSIGRFQARINRNYMIGLNSAFQLEAWWKDFNECSVGSPQGPVHPVEVWTRGKWPSNHVEGWVYVLTLASGPITTNATVGPLSINCLLEWTIKAEFSTKIHPIES